MAQQQPKSVFRAKRGFVAHVGGRPRRIRRGDLVQEGDGVLTGRAHLFDEVSEYVEQATAGPGERRSVSVPRKAKTEDDGKAKPAAKTAAKTEPAAKTTQAKPDEGAE